jgi:hypothetical protein
MFSTSSSSLSKPVLKAKDESAPSPVVRNAPQSSFLGIDSSQIELELGSSRPITAAALDNDEDRETMVIVPDTNSGKR